MFVKLNVDPERSVTIPIITTDQDGASTDDYSGVPANVTFASGDTSASFTFTAVDDTAVDDGESVKLTFGTLPTGVTAGTDDEATVSITDNDTPSVVVTVPSDPFTVAEEGTAGTYEVRLGAQPAANVVIGVTAGGDARVAAPGGTAATTAELTFTADNWGTAQTVTVTAVHDADAADEQATITHTVNASSSDEYRSVTIDAVTVNIDDDDTPGLVIDATDLTVEVEEGDSASYTVRLATEPSDDVTVTIAGHANTDVSLLGDVQTNTLTFTPTTWDTLQTVTVEAHHDDDGRNDIVDLHHSTSSSDAAYHNLGDVTVAVTVVDDDEAGLIFNLDPLELTVAEMGLASYTVRLASQPAVPVFITIAGLAGTEVSLSGDVQTNTLTFNLDNWDMPQTVTVEAHHDDDGRNDIVDLHHSTSSSDLAYHNLGDVTVAVIVVDDDSPAVLVIPTGITAVEEGDEVYTVRLATEPSANVTVTISGHDGTDASLSGSDVSNDELTFTTDNWDTLQTVTVEADGDVDTVNDVVTLSHTATSTGDSDYDNLTIDPRTGDPVTVTVTITDNDSPAVAINPTAFTVDEDDSASYTVKLVTRPSVDVTVTVTVPPNTGVSLTGGAPTSDLTFTNTSWEMPQTVTVHAAPDDDARDGEVTVTHTASGADYNNLTISDVTVTIDDDDDAGLVIDATAIDVEEEGSASYTVRLATEPSANVTVTISGHAGTDASLTGSHVSNDELIFTTDNWGMPQTVTVIAADDGDSDNEDVVTLAHTTTSIDTDYNNLTGDPVAVSITDNDTDSIVGNDTAAVIVSTESVALGEGEAGEYTITLGSQPTAEVTVSIVGHAGSEVTLGGDTLSNDHKLTFTAAKWSTAQTVTVTANQDDDAIDETDVELTHVAESADSDYNSISVGSVTVTVTDDDTAAVTVSPTHLSVTEGDSGTYEVSLSSQPTSDVTVTIAGHADSDVTLSGLTLNNDKLTFTAADRTAVQTVTVTAAEDPDAGTDAPVDLTHTAASSDPDYVGISISVSSVMVTVTENDTATVTVSPTRLTVPEIDIGTYTVTLSHVPTSDVTIDITVSCDPGSCEVTTNPTQLTFDASNWDTAQTVTVIAGNDDDAIDDEVTITHAVDKDSADEYAQFDLADVTVTVTDNDMAGLSVSPDLIWVLEEGTGTFTVVLTSEPSDDVTVAVASADPSIATVTEGASLTFTTTNWDTAKTVTVSGADDPDTNQETVVVTASATGGGYDNLYDTVTVTVTDNDHAGVVLSPRSLTVTEGETGTYTLSLAQVPTADVIVDITATGDVTVNDDDTASVTFRPSNWQQPRQVTVAAAEDDDEVEGMATITHAIGAGSASEYASIDAGSVEVTIIDKDTPGLSISSQALAVTNGGTRTYMVSLNSAPGPGVTQSSLSPQFQVPEVRAAGDPGSSTDVVVRIYAGGGLSVEPGSLTFTADDWDEPQSVTVTASGAEANSRFTIVHKIEGTDGYADIANVGLDLNVTSPRSSSDPGSNGGGGGGSSGGGGGSSGGGGGGGGGLDVGVATFVVASGWSASDVGVASVLAARTSGAVVVYTASDALSEETRELLREASPAEVVIVGGTAAVSRDVRTQIRAASSESGISRITGAGRADTAAATARRILGGPSGAGRVTLIVANGWSSPDIGAAAALAARSGRSAVLYTQPDSLPEASAALLRDYDVARVILIGGTAAISTAVYDQIAAAAAGGASVSRLTGADRVDTAAQAARRVLGNPAGAPEGVTLVIANGWSAPDVGVAAALAAATENSAVAYTMQGELPEATRSADPRLPAQSGHHRRRPHSSRQRRADCHHRDRTQQRRRAAHHRQHPHRHRRTRRTAHPRKPLITEQSR